MSTFAVIVIKNCNIKEELTKLSEERKRNMNTKISNAGD